MFSAQSTVPLGAVGATPLFARRTCNGAVGGRKETARREESKREETDRVT
ncbi:unnamed protein product [Ectocarpus sp. CCAP 1310/34]|nr:unnamed protein product [Ectocarpus sp. CCAP 1310/34]